MDEVGARAEGLALGTTEGLDLGQSRETGPWVTMVAPEWARVSGAPQTLGRDVGQ